MNQRLISINTPKDRYHMERADIGYCSLNIIYDDIKNAYPHDSVKEPELLKKHFNSIIQRMYRSPLPIKMRNVLWHVLRRTDLDRTWIEPFAEYWTKVVKGRPFHGHQDFDFQRCYYRLNFQSLQIPNDASLEEHERVWQHPINVYFLFQQVYKQRYFNNIRLIEKTKRYSAKSIKSVLEYGCGVAPIITSYFDFYSTKKYRFVITDIDNIGFHYATYRFRSAKNVFPIVLNIKDDFQLVDDIEVDVIYCMTVFEHMNNPLRTVERLTQALNKNGLFIFDYIKSDASGLDTEAGLKQRSSVLDFIRDHYNILEGKLDKEQSMGITISRKL